MGRLRCPPPLPTLALALVLVLALAEAGKPRPHHSVHTDLMLDFPAAQARCRGAGGGLATLRSAQRVASVLGRVALALRPHQLPGNFSFWVGLHKDRNQCTRQELSLRGFRWEEEEEGEEEGEVDKPEWRWWAEPRLTCTSALCAALMLRWSGERVVAWALGPTSCKTPLSYICKTGPGPPPATPTPGLGAGPKPGPATEPAPATESGTPPGTDPAPGPGPHPPSGPDPVPAPCRTPTVPRARAFVVPDDGAGQMGVECWSGEQVSLVCSGGAWLVAAGTTPGPRRPLEEACPCSAGFRLGGGGSCEDEDECESAPCGRQGCVNTPGSYRCVCLGDEGEQGCQTATAGPSPAPGRGWAELAPLLGAVLGGALLLLLLGVIVCCLLGRRKRRRRAARQKTTR